MLNLYKILPSTLTEGPGKRFCIWTQGCNLTCEDCCNASLQAFAPRNLISEEELCKQIEEAKKNYDIEGVTFLGGEPLLQSKGLSVVAKYCKSIDLSVVCFTGFVYPHFENIVFVDDLLQYVDVLIDGPYIKKYRSDKRNWVGSSNQRFLYFTDKYNSSIETVLESEIEVHLYKTEITVNGSPTILA